MNLALKSTLIFVLVGVCAMVSLNADTNPVVSVTGGQIVGRILPAGGSVFKGIPFARPPVGELRWREPAPVVPWEGVLDAGTFGSPCVQSRQQSGEATSEDCLYLNVWTPDWPATSRKPVMVWFHWGGNVSGAGSLPLFDGFSLTRRGVVLVNINYRLGLFSLFAHPGLTAESPHHASGNYGLMDQIAALKWVAANIAKFGGDPARVTIFGQSGGGIDTGLMITSPLAKGLFSGVIQESGPPLVREFPPLAKYEEFGMKVAADLQAPAGGAGAVKFLRGLPAADILKVQVAVLAQRRPPMLGPIRPNIDGYVLPMSSGLTFSTGRELPVPLMIGNTAREQLLVTSPEELKKAIADAFGPAAAKAEAFYGLTNGGKGNEDPLLGAADIQFSTDRWYRCGNVAEALWHSQRKYPTYQYQFDYAPPGRNATFHGAEVQYVFGNLLQGKYTDVDRKLSDIMQQYWTNFAKTGDPNGGNLVKWPRFDPAMRGYLEFTTDGVAVARRALRRELCELFLANYYETASP